MWALAPVRDAAQAGTEMAEESRMIAGVDFSSRAIDVVLLEDDSDRAEWHRFELTGGTPFERARSLRGCFPTRSWWDDHGVYLLGIEDPHSRFPHVAKALGISCGAVAALLPRDLCVIATPPKEWKRVFCGNANANKDAVVNAVPLDSLWSGCSIPTLDIPQDAFDAYGIAYAVRKLNNDAIAA
jgi:hypothetical protein